MGMNDAYEVEVVYRVNDIFCRNVFHFIAKIPGATSTSVVEFFDANFTDSIRLLMSSEVTFIQSRGWLLNDPIADSYSKFHEGKIGNRPVSAIDPRICIYVNLRGTPNRGNFSNGGLFISGIGSDWAQQAPKVVQDVQHAFQLVIDNLVASFGAVNNVAPLRWGILSRRIKSDPSKQLLDYFFPVSEAHVRPYFASLRTRRPRGPF